MAKYDVAIIGSGPGGYVAAIRAGELGLKTVVVEKDPFLGGTCLHVGCIPTKVLLHHAEIYDHCKEAAEFGIELSGLKLNWATSLGRKDKIVKKHAKGIEFLFKKNKVEWVQGWGRYEGPGKISVEKDGKKTTIEASNILMVSGSEARALPGIEPDHKTILTNRSILELPEIPKTLIVVGAGAVGVEFASIYNSFGTQVTILEALPRVVPVEDEEISAELEKTFQKKNIADSDGLQGGQREKGRERRHRLVHGQGWKVTDAAGGETAAGRRPQADDGRLRTGKIESQDRARICARRAQHGNGGKGSVRDRRHRGRAAATGARGDDGRNHRRDAHCRKTDAADSQRPDSECNVLRAADWLHWIDRKAGAGMPAMR